MMALLRRALARFEWIMVGEFVGAMSLFALLFGGLFLGCGLGLK